MDNLYEKDFSIDPELYTNQGSTIINGNEIRIDANSTHVNHTEIFELLQRRL